MRGISTIAAGCLALAAWRNVKREARQAIRDSLSDPDSQKFYRSKSASYQGRRWVCYDVNYKKPAGGYIGKQSYIVTKLTENDSRRVGAPYDEFSTCDTALAMFDPDYRPSAE